MGSNFVPPFVEIDPLSPHTTQLSTTGGANKVPLLDSSGNLTLTNTARLVLTQQSGGGNNGGVYIDNIDKVHLDSPGNISIVPAGDGAAGHIIQLGNLNNTDELVKIERNGVATSGYTTSTSKRFFYYTSYWNGSAAVTAIDGWRSSVTTGGVITGTYYNPADESNGVAGGTGVLTFTTNGLTLLANKTVVLTGSTSGTTTIAPPAIAGSATITMPGVTGTLSTLAGSETFTNKTLTSPVINNLAPSGAFSITQNSVGVINSQATNARANSLNIIPINTDSTYAAGIQMGGARTDATTSYNLFEYFSPRTSYTDTAGDFSIATDYQIYFGRLSSTGGGSTGKTTWRSRTGTAIAVIDPISAAITLGVTTSVNGTLNVTGANVAVGTAGNTVQIKSGTNAKAGTFTLSSGTVTVSNTSVTANSVVCCTVKTASGTLGTGSPEIVITAGAGFTATGIATDNSTYNFVIFEVN